MKYHGNGEPPVPGVDPVNVSDDSKRGRNAGAHCGHMTALSSEMLACLPASLQGSTFNCHQIKCGGGNKPICLQLRQLTMCHHGE